MSKTTKVQLEAQNMELVEENKRLREAMTEATVVEHRTYQLMFARGTSKQSRNTIANVAVALSRDGKVGITGIIASVIYDPESKKAEIKPLNRDGYNFFGFGDAVAAQKLADYVLFLADMDQIPDVYPIKFKFHGKVTKPKVATPKVKAQSQIQLALC